MEKEDKTNLIHRFNPLCFTKAFESKRNRWIIYILLVFLAYFLLSNRYPYLFEIGGDSYVDIYASSTVFRYGKNGWVSGWGKFGQYYVNGGGSGGCCKSADLKVYYGKPKGEIAVHWQAMYEEPDISRYYYAYHPSPEIEVPSRSVHHSKYIIFFSFGQLALLKDALTEEQLDSYKFYVKPSTIGYQVGSADTFYYRVYSNYKHEFSTIRKTPLNEFHSIKGIEVTEEQYDYIIKHKYLDENAPNLTHEQSTYIKQQNDRKSIGFYWNKIFPNPTVLRLLCCG